MNTAEIRALYEKACPLDGVTCEQSLVWIAVPEMLKEVERLDEGWKQALVLANTNAKLFDGATARAEQAEAERDALMKERDDMSLKFNAAMGDLFTFATCSICAHVAECEEIDGRCEGRGYGTDCFNEDTEEPHFLWRGAERSRDDANG